MARNEEPRAWESLMLFQVDPSWYERYWLQQPAPRKPGKFAFFRRILSQLRLTRRKTRKLITHLQMRLPDLASRRRLLGMETGFGQQQRLGSTMTDARRQIAYTLNLVEPMQGEHDLRGWFAERSTIASMVDLTDPENGKRRCAALGGF